MKLKKSKVPVLLLILCMAAGTLFGCGSDSDGKDEPASVTIAQSSDPQTLDPHKVGGDISANIFRNVCETLLTYDENWEIAPLLAESYEQVSDTEWIFHLKEGVTFSNGEPFDAEAAIWNFKRAASDKHPRQAFEFRDYVKTYEAVDELTLKFTLSKPDIFFTAHIAEVPMLEPKHSEEIGEEAIGNDIIGTGPYVFKNWEADKEILLEKNPTYWGTEPDADRVVFKTIPEAATRIAEMVNGNVDIIMNVQNESVETLEKSDGIKVFPKKLNRTEYIGFNTYDWCETPELKDPKVRQALNYAVDVDTIIETVMGGYGERVSNLWRTDYDGFDEALSKYYSYDPEKAKKLLAEAGYADGFDLTLMTDVDNHAKAQEVTEAVGSYLEAIGIDVEVQVLDDTTAYAIIVNGQSAKKCPGMFDWNWGTKPGLYESTLTGVLSSEGMSSYNKIEGYDQLIEKLLAETTAEGRAPYIKEIQEMMVENPACLYLFRLYDIYAVSERVQWEPEDHYAMLASDMKIVK